MAASHTGNQDSMPRGTIGLGELIHAFEITNRTLNRSPKTTAWHSSNLRLFKDFLAARGSSLAISDIGIQEAREYILYLQERKRYVGHPLTPTRDERLSPRTVRAHVESLKAFFSWLFAEGYTESNKLKRLRFPAVPRRYVEVLNAEEIGRILASIDQSNPMGLHNMPVVVTLLDTGLRLAELVSLKFADARVEQGYLKVMGKGSRERMVPIGVSTQRLLLRYIYQARPQPSLAQESNVFLADTGRPLTINCVRLMLERLGRQSGVPRLHAHLCRHTFATNYLMNRGDIFTLQQILGHSSLEMVRRYVILSSEFVIGQHSRFSPLDTMHPKVNRRPRRRLSSRSS